MSERRPRRQEEPDGTFRWHDVEVRAYKTEADATWKDLSRQVLFDNPELACQVRFFEVEPGGYTTLERHHHAHAVIVVQGHGQCLVGDQIFELCPYDLIETPPWAWHQFRAAPNEHLGFVCIVNQDRDRPQLPTPDDLAQLAEDPAVAAFLQRLGPDDRHPA